MKKSYRIIFYIFLNIIISAATILLVMWLYDRSHPTPSVTDENLATLTNQSESSPPTESNPLNGAQSVSTTEFISGDYDVEIVTIVGPGDLNIEYVEISNKSQGAVDISGWQLMDDDGQIFTFPTIILNNDGKIKILSQMGIDTVIELYWQSETPIWESGETARLLDKSGNIVSTYSIP